MKIKISDGTILNESTKVNLVLSDKLITKVSSFLELSDVPDSFVGKELQTMRVNSTATGVEFSEVGQGDMIKIVYDPTGIEGDVFDMDNMIEGTTNLILEQTERDKLNFISITGTVDLDTIESNSHVPVTVLDSSSVDFTLTGQQITASVIDSAIDHDSLNNTHNLTTDIDHNSLLNYVGDEHIDWTVTQVENIHPDNYTDTTYVSADFTHNDLTGLNVGTIYQHITTTQETNFETAYTHSQVVLGNPHNVTLSDVGGTTNHTELSNIGTNTHAQIDTHLANLNIHKDHSLINITAGSGLNGGGSIDNSITLNIDITELTAITSIDDSNPLLIYQTGNKKITFGNFVDNIDITASQVTDFDTEVSNNTSVSANTTHRTSDGTDHTYIDQDVRTTASPTHISLKFTPQTPPVHEEGLVYYDSAKKALTYYNEEADVALNIGEEFYIRVYNDTGSTITDGKICYISGAESGFPTIALANAKYYNKTRVIGVATHDIENGTYGYVTRLGVVSGFDTSAYVVESCVYLSCSTPGDITIAEPDDSCFEVHIGKVLVSDAINGVIYVDPNMSDKTRETNDTNGFPATQRTGTTLSFVEGTRTFTIAPTGSEFYYYIYGVKYIKDTAESIVIDNTSGEHLIYYDLGVLRVLANPTNAQIDTIIRTHALVAYLYWNATLGELLYLGDERHGISMSPETHDYLHFTVGARYLSGLALNSILADENGSLDTHAQFGTDMGMITDEDLPHVISAVDSTTGLAVWYRDGSGGLWRKTTNAGFSVLNTGTGRLAYNLDTAGTWSLVEVPNGDYVNYFVVASNDILKKPISVPGTTYYTTIADAEIGANDEANTLLNTLVSPEFRIIATVIFQTGNTAGANYSNSVQAKIVSTTDGNDYIDWRTTATTPGGGVGSHSSLSGLSEVGVHPSSSISNVTTNFNNILSATDDDVLTALETIDDMSLGDISNVDDSTIADGQVLRFVNATGNYEPYTLTGGSDEKVSIDSSATPDYIGTTGSDGVLRVGSLLSYTDGGNFVTLNVNESSLDHNNLTNTHNLTTDIDHNTLTNYTITQHRTINDAGTAVTDLWSASKINTELGLKTDETDFTSHTGDSTIHYTQATISITASQVSDFDTEVSNNTTVAANASARHSAVTVIDSTEIDFTLTGQDITASLITGSIDVLKLDAGVQTSLGLADSSLQSGDNISLLTNDSAFTTEILKTENITLTSTDIANKYRDLTEIPDDNTSVNVFIVGGSVQFYADDFTVITDGTNIKRLNWNGLDMEGILAENDKIVVSYTYS